MKKFTKKQWIKFSIAAVLYTLFAIWMQNLWLLLGLIVLVDIFLTHYIPWGAWKRSKNPAVRNVLEWVDDIVFALVAVYFINLFVFQNYQIPSSSLEKSLLVGDYLFVSKLSYGPRVPNTPISFPLVQNTLPILNCKSYLDWPEWGYKRVKGLGHVKRNDIVVFNFPAGDTIAVKVQNPDYYSLVEEYGRERILLDKATFGEVMYRPVDKRENYVKRCIGMPGDTLQLIDNQVYIDGKPAENPKDMQFNYFIETDGSPITEEQFRLMDVSKDDRMLASSGGYYQNLLSYLGFTPNANGQYNPVYRLPLTKKALVIAEKLPTVKKVIIEPETLGGPTYPVGYNTGWTRDNFGPLWIPKKGATIPLDERNLALYSRCIKNYENNTLEVKDGKVYINGQKTFITGAKEYPYMLVLARDPQPKDPKKAFTLWWVDSSKPGIKINPLHKIGWHMLSTCEVYLDNVEVEESDMVGEEGMGFLNVMYNFEMERLINAARSTGFAECAFEDAARYANQRIAFGKPIGHNQMIQEKLALMAIKIDNMRNMVLKVAWQADQHQSLRTSAALAKLYCARTAMEVIDDAIQIMGGLGYTDEARVSRFWRDVRCERIGGGTDEIMIYVAGRQILKDYQNK